MTQAAYRNKFIASLVRILTHKEAQLSSLRHSHKQRGEYFSTQQSTHLHATDGLTKQHLTSTAHQLKQIRLFLANMEAQIKQLTHELAQEEAATAECQRKLHDSHLLQREYLRKIEQMEEQMRQEEMRCQKWREEGQALKLENESLREQVERLRVQAQYELILERKMEGFAIKLLEGQKFEHKVVQMVDAIVKQYCCSFQPPLFPTKMEQMSAKLAAIENCLQESRDLRQYKDNGIRTLSRAQILEEKKILASSQQVSSKMQKVNIREKVMKNEGFASNQSFNNNANYN